MGRSVSSVALEVEGDNVRGGGGGGELPCNHKILYIKNAIIEASQYILCSLRHPKLSTDICHQTVPTSVSEKWFHDLNSQNTFLRHGQNKIFKYVNK